jgi:hypothetical protein
MTFTYDINDIETDTVTQLRRIIGDVVDSGHEFEDEELAFFIGNNGDNIYRAASQALDALASKYAKLVDKAVGDLRIAYSDRSKAYAARAKELYSIVPNAFVAYPLAGGITISSKQTNREDTDIVQPSFSVDMMERPYPNDPKKDWWP